MTHDYKDSDHCAHCGHESGEPIGSILDTCQGLEINTLKEIEDVIEEVNSMATKARGFRDSTDHFEAFLWMLKYGVLRYRKDIEREEEKAKEEVEECSMT